MASFHRAGHERINVYLVGSTYLFKHYFEGDDVFSRLREHYNPQQYRFEVPSDAFEDLQEFLAEHGYGLVVVEPIEEFAVVLRKYTDHPDGIFKDSVIQRSTDGYNCFLLTDRDAVERAVENGATWLSDTDLELPF
jgi:hypothetical protein